MKRIILLLLIILITSCEKTTIRNHIEITYYNGDVENVSVITRTFYPSFIEISKGDLHYNGFIASGVRKARVIRVDTLK